AMRHAHGVVPQTTNFTGGIGAMAGGFMLIVVAIFAVVGIAFWVLSTYLFCRLRFTLFDLVVYKQGQVGQAWSKYRRQSWRYFGVVLLASFIFLILIAATTGPFVIRMLSTFKTLAAQGANPNPNPFPVLAAMLPFVGICFLLALVWVVVDAVLQDFVLPPMALENASIEGSFERFFYLLREDFGSFLVYLLLRFIIALGISWVLMFAVV